MYVEEPCHVSPMKKKVGADIRCATCETLCIFLTKTVDINQFKLYDSNVY